jgi:hypothetical protein
MISSIEGCCMADVFGSSAPYMGNLGHRRHREFAAQIPRPIIAAAAAQSWGRRAQAFAATVIPTFVAVDTTDAEPSCGQGICENVSPSQKVERKRNNMAMSQGGAGADRKTLASFVSNAGQNKSSICADRVQSTLGLRKPGEMKPRLQRLSWEFETFSEPWLRQHHGDRRV